MGKQEGIGAGTIGAIRETAGLHVEDPDSDLGRFAEGLAPGPRALSEAKRAWRAASEEDRPRITELIDHLYRTRDVPDETNAAEYVETAAESTITDLRSLLSLAALVDGEEVKHSNDELLALGIGYGEAGPLSNDTIREQADERLTSLPLAVEATTTFEVVLGVGGPDTRLCFECASDRDGPEAGQFEIRRVFYRYSWSGSAEIELTGEDKETAEAFGRRVIPELVE